MSSLFTELLSSSGIRSFLLLWNINYLRFLPNLLQDTDLRTIAYTGMQNTTYRLNQLAPLKCHSLDRNTRS